MAQTDGSSGLKWLIVFVAALFMLVGAAGMAMSFFPLRSHDLAAVTTGQAGFVAGAVLMGSGLIAMAIARR